MTTHRSLHIYRPIRWATNVTVQPTQEPILLEEMKTHARVTAPEEEALLAGNIIAAREWAEAYTQRALITQTRTLKIDRFPNREDAVIELPGGAIQSVSSISYTDTDGNPQTWATANYVVDTEWEPGRIGLAYNKNWPTDARIWDLPITITYVAGYGDDPSDVPQLIREAIMRVALELYEMRQETTSESMESVAWGARALASRYRINRLV